MPPKVNKGGNTIQAHLRPSSQDTSPTPRGSPSPSAPHHPPIDVAALKAELVCALREDVTAIFKTELHTALGDNLSTIKSELQALKGELSSQISNVRQDFTELKGTVAEIEHSLSTCTDDVVILQAKVQNLEKEMVKLENRCEDLESRSRRQNIRIIGVPEDDLTSPASVSKLLKEAFKLETEPLVDRAHRALVPKPRPDDRPRAIIAKLHYYTDCTDIIKKARELQRIKVRSITISVFPDHTPKTARARAAFNEVRRLLRDIEGVRFGLLYPARMRITYKGEQRDFTSPEEVKAYIKTITK